MDEKTVYAGDVAVSAGSDADSGEGQLISAGADHLQRKLGAKEVQLFAIGGAIGTGVFISMALYLPTGGPAGFLLGFLIWSMFMFCINECFAEMVCYAPVSAPFIRLASDWVDPALGFAVSWAWFVEQALLVPAEITALQTLIGFWTDKMPVEATVFITIVLYGLLNCVSVKWFGIAEFYLSIGKVFLIFLCFGFTFVTMVGGNPLHDAYGFRYWQNPGAFSEYLTTGSLGSFWGFLSCMTLATFSICGPEYVSMVAAETKTPRRILPACFQSFVWRLLFFFCGSALCLGIVIPYNDPTLAAFIDGTAAGKGTSAASPYVIAMKRMDIPGLPHLFNAMVMLSVFSCGNGCLFSASRILFSMATAGRAPKFLAKTTGQGIPIYAVLFSLLFALLALLQINNGSAQVLKYMIDLCTTCQLLTYMSTCITFVHFYKAMKKQGRSRDSLAFKGRFQPYEAYIGIAGTVTMMLLLGFDTLSPFAMKWFFLDYTFLAVFPLFFVIYKLVMKTTYIRAGNADLSLGGAIKQIDEYEDLVVPEPQNILDKFFGGTWSLRKRAGKSAE